MLILDNKAITTDIITILKAIRNETKRKFFKDIRVKGTYAMITCPLHANADEKHPSCGIVIDPKDPKYGYIHCFTCGEVLSLPQLVEHCFDEKPGFGKEWLIERFGDTFFQQELLLADIELNPKLEVKQNKILDESILQEYNYYHDYMWKRGLTQEVVDRFKVGFNPKT